MTSFSRILFDYDRPETTGEALFFRLFELYIAGSAIHLAWVWGAYILRISDVVLPLGIANYVDVSFLFGNGLSLGVAALVMLFVALGYFRAFRPAYLIAFLLLHLQFSARYTLGEIPHSSNVVGMTLLGLSLAVFLFEDALHRRRFTMGFTYFFVGLGYTLAAFCKLIGTGPGWSDGRHLWLWIHEKAVDAMAYNGLLDYNLLQEFALSSLPFATLILTFGLMAELFAWGMWWPRFRMVVLLGVLALHVGIYLVMNIMFWHTFFELILLAFPWATWLNALVGSRVTARAPGFIYS